MKKLLILLFLMSLSAHARSSVFSTSYHVFGTSEQEAINIVQEIIPQMENLTFKPIRKAAIFNNCRVPLESKKPHYYIKVNGVSINKMYKLDEGVLLPYYRASIRYVLRRCRESRN